MYKDLQEIKFLPIGSAHSTCSPVQLPSSRQYRGVVPLTMTNPGLHQKVALAPTWYPLTDLFPFSGVDRNGHRTTEETFIIHRC